VISILISTLATVYKDERRQWHAWHCQRAVQGEPGIAFVLCRL